MVMGRHIKSGFKVLASRFNQKRYPIKINFISTYNCDNNCSYCKISQLEKKKELSTKQVKDMIDSLSEFGAEHITFIGGEPLMRKDIGELISHAKKRGLLTTMSSNGNNVRLKTDELKDLDLLISCLNGPKEVHDSIRGKGNYDKIIEILSANEIKKGMLATIILTKQNVKYVDFVLKKATELDFYINFQPVFKNELAKVENDELDGVMLSKDEVRSVFNYIIKKKKQGFPVSNSYQSLRNFARDGKVIFKKCYLGRLSVTIDPEGNVYRCYKEVNNKEKINGVELGWEKALYQMPINDCVECHYGCHIEDNFLFMLNPSSIVNLIKLNKIFKNG